MKVTVIGGGFVGVTTGVVFAEWGHEVHLVEVAPARRSALEDARLPFFEEGLEEALQGVIQSGKLNVVGSLKEAPASDAVFLCVGTPSLEDGSADLSQLREAAAELKRWDKCRVVVVKSTVPPGTTEKVVAPVLGEGFHVAMNPEFLKEGLALKDAREPDRVVLGVKDAESQQVLQELYAGVDCPVLVVSPATAELTKYAANAMLALRITFANEIANLAERVGVHVDDVMRGVGLDPRIGPDFLRAGPGFGGSCFPKDVKALRAVGLEHDMQSKLLEAVLAANEEQPFVVVERVAQLTGGLDGKRVALLGLAFKPGTSDVRETRALAIHEGLRAAGAEVACYDPQANEEFLQLVPDALVASSAQEALEGADACILHTEWPEFQKIPGETYKKQMSRALVYDTRRVLDATALGEAGVEVHGLGEGLRRRRAQQVQKE